MRLATTWMAAMSLGGVLMSAGVSAERALTRIPAEFQGRYLASLDQCSRGYERWLYITDLQIQEAEGIGYVVSVRRIAPREVEIDMTWRPSGKGRGETRTVDRFFLSEDGRTLIEKRDGNSVSRVRCAPAT